MLRIRRLLDTEIGVEPGDEFVGDVQSSGTQVQIDRIESLRHSEVTSPSTVLLDVSYPVVHVAEHFFQKPKSEVLLSKLFRAASCLLSSALS